MRLFLIFVLLLFLIPVQTVVRAEDIEFSSVEIRAIHYNGQRHINMGL